jgi:predicted Zn finger-like uncharacterized protein
MALATACPRCHTRFRVVPDQLKIRRGLVRCGSCQHVFSGIDFLRYVEEEPHPPAGSAGAAPRGPATLTRIDTEPTAPRTSDGAVTAPVGWRATEPPSDTDGNADGVAGARAESDAGRSLESSVESSVESPDEPLAEPAAEPPAEPPAGPPAEPHTEPPAEPPITAPARTRAAPRPAASARRHAPVESEAVDFFAPTSRAGGFSSRGSVFAAAACLVLAVLLPLQLTLVARDWLPAWLPATRPALTALSELTGLTLQPPRHLDALTLESFDLKVGAAPGLLSMNALVRNQAPFAVRWPAMELSLTDAAGALIVRKVLIPGDYLAPARLAAGLPGSVEQPVSVTLEALDLQPIGYSVKLFYP